MTRRQIEEIVDVTLEAREELLRREVPHLEALYMCGCAMGTMLVGAMLRGNAA